MIDDSILKKIKKPMIILLFTVAFILLFTMPSNAASYTKSFPTNDGSIQLNLTGLTLDEGKQYEYGLTTKGGTPEKWYLITDYTTTTATVNISGSDTTLRKVLQLTDEGYLYIREKDNAESYVVENMQIDLKLPLFYSINVSGNNNGISTSYYTINSVYGLGSRSYKFEKITDSTVIEKYLEIKQKDGDIKELEPYVKTTYPTTGYEDVVGFGSIYSYQMPEDGLYYMWIKLTSTESNSKTVYSCIIHDGLPDSTSISDYLSETTITDSIKATSGHTEYVNSQLEYRAAPGDEIKITVSFTNEIKVNEYPTLTIKFGDGENITVTDGNAGSDNIVYTYKIQSGDLGTLQIVNFSGGNVVDNDGNSAVITRKDLSGIALVAVESINSNSGNNNNSGNGGFNITTPNENNQNGSGTENKNQIIDNTIATGKIPQTGLKVGIIILISTVIISAVVGYIKSRNLRDIK